MIFSERQVSILLINVIVICITDILLLCISKKGDPKLFQKCITPIMMIFALCAGIDLVAIAMIVRYALKLQ